MKKVLINNAFNFEIEKTGEKILLNGTPIDVDMQSISESSFHFLLDNMSYRAEIVEVDYRTKEAVIKVNGNEYQISLKDESDHLLERLGMEGNTNAIISKLNAPMPGLVLNILVKPGDQLKKGDSLLILEAMKMENLIKSPSDFTIKSVEIQQGDKVEKNQVLLYFE